MDNHSKLLISLKSNGPSSASKIADVIIGWKNTFSFYWYHTYINDDQEKLDFVFNLLFELTEFPDSSVTIASFNAIGALLVSLSPFRSQELILSFKNTLSSLEVSPNTSCAVIATFVFLSHHVSDNSISHFIESTPIFPHFGADLRTFIHHIPNLIEQMDRLNMEFHQALLRSLISSFGRNPVSSFIESIMLLIKRFPNKLLSDLMEFIESNKLEDTLLSVGGPILNDHTFSELLSIEQKYAFLNALKKKFFIPKSGSVQSEAASSFNFAESEFELQTEVTASELEQAVSIIIGLKKQSDEELRKSANIVSDAVWNQRKKLKSVFQRVLYPLSTDINELRPCKEDSTNEMSKKIMALSSFENADDDEILSICEPFIEVRDECFISVLTFLARSMKEKCHKLFKKLIEKDDYSWVQRIAILNLIDNLDQFQMVTYMKDYNQKCIDFLIGCALSLQTELSSQSRDVISRFISLNNVELFRDSILKCDFFNFQITKNILMLLNVIVGSISPLPMRCFIGIVLELFDFTLSDIINTGSEEYGIEGMNIYPPFVSDCFEFLSHYPGLFPYNKSIETICLCKMQEVYYSFTQEKIFFQPINDNQSQASIAASAVNENVSNRKKNQAAALLTKMLKNNVRPILSTITTDVVADASLVRYNFLKPLKNCMQYLISNQMQSAVYRSIFLKLLPIFPEEIIPYFYDQSTIVSNCQESHRTNFLSEEEIELIRPNILRIFSSNRDQIVIANCCEFFYQSNIINQKVLIQVKKIFENTKIKSSLSAFEFFKLIYSVEPANAIAYLKKLLNVPDKNNENNQQIETLPDLNKNELALLASNIPSVYQLLSQLDRYSFLQFKTNRFSAKNWFERNDYATWPLIDFDLTEEIKKMFDKSYSVHIKDCNLIDNNHWTFLMTNKTLFFKDKIKSYLNSNKSSLKTICVFKAANNEKNHFHFSNKILKEIEENLDPLAKVFPTTALLLKKGKFIKNEILIKNFLQFSKILVNDDLLNQMKAEFPNLSSIFDDYTKRLSKIKNKNDFKKRVNKRLVLTNQNETKEEIKEDLIQIKQNDTQEEINEENNNELIIEEEEEVGDDEGNEEIQIKTSESQEEIQIKQDELETKSDENQTKQNELINDIQYNLNEQNEDNQVNPEEQLTKQNDQNKENQEKSEEQQAKQKEQNEDNQVNPEEQQAKQNEHHEENKEKPEEQHEDSRINPSDLQANQEDSKVEPEEQQTKQDEMNQVKAEEQHEESQANPVEKKEKQGERHDDIQEMAEINHEEPQLKTDEYQGNQEEHTNTSELKNEIQVKAGEQALSAEMQNDQITEKPEDQPVKQEQQPKDNQDKLENNGEIAETNEETTAQNHAEQQDKEKEQNKDNHPTQEEQSNEAKRNPNEKHDEQITENQSELIDKCKEDGAKTEAQSSNEENRDKGSIIQTQPQPSDVTLSSSSIPGFDPNFPMKSKFLKKLCNQPQKDSVVYTMYRMHLIDRINEIRSPKQFFYFLRFLRINIVVMKNTRESLAIRKNTAENFGPIATKLKEFAHGRTSHSSQTPPFVASDSDTLESSSNNSGDFGSYDYEEERKDLSFILVEFVKLCSKLFSLQDLHKVIKSVSFQCRTESIELLLVSNLVIHSSKFRNIVSNAFNVSNGYLTNYSVRPLKSSNLAKVPSSLSFIIANIKILPDEESSMFFIRHYKSLFESDIVCDMAIEYLSFYLTSMNDFESVKKYNEYFDGNVISQMALQLFDTKRSIFKKAGDKKLLQILFALIKGQFKNNLLQFQPLIEKISVCGYSLPFAIDLVTCYFSAVAFNVFQIPLTQSQKAFLKQKELNEKQQKKASKAKVLTEEAKRQNMLNFQKEFGIKEIRIVQSIYQVCPSIMNAMKLGKTLILASSFFDSLALIFGVLAPFEEGPFLGIFCIAVLFYNECANDFEKRKRFVDLVNSFDNQNSTFKSRSKALKLIISNEEIDDSVNFEKAFAVACLETNDESKIENAINLFNH